MNDINTYNVENTESVGFVVVTYLGTRNLLKLRETLYG